MDIQSLDQMEDTDRPTKRRCVEPGRVEDLCDLRHCDALQMLESLGDGSIDLVITDPPYITSRKSGMDEHHQAVQRQRDTG